MTAITLVSRDHCPICSAQDVESFIPFPKIPVVKCRNCSFTYSSKILSGEELTGYYENNFGSQRHLQGQKVNSLTNLLALERLTDLKRVTSVLDIGTGYGFLLHELRERYSADVTGIELSKQEATHAKTTLGLRVINAPLGNAGLQKNAYDLVTSFEVIEHVPYPLDFINELVEYVKPGGHLVLMTDNFDSRMAKSLGPGFPKWIPHSHISHFSAATLRKALETTKSLKL